MFYSLYLCACNISVTSALLFSPLFRSFAVFMLLPFETKTIFGCLLALGLNHLKCNAQCIFSFVFCTFDLRMCARWIRRKLKPTTSDKLRDDSKRRANERGCSFLFSFQWYLMCPLFWGKGRELHLLDGETTHDVQWQWATHNKIHGFEMVECECELVFCPLNYS